MVKNSDVFLDVAIEREACPLGLAPTAKVPPLLWLWVMLAVALLSERKFTPGRLCAFSSWWIPRTQAISDSGKYDACRQG